MRISIRPTAAVGLVALLPAVVRGMAWEREGILWLSLLAAAGLHELGHLAAAALAGVRVTELRLDLFGARLKTEGWLSYRQELALAGGGPAVNLLTVLWLYPLWARSGRPVTGWVIDLLLASAGLGLVNLLPVATLDGGRMLGCFTALLWGEAASRLLLQVCTGVVLLLLWLLSVYALLRAGNLLSLFVFSFSLLLRAVGGEEGASGGVSPPRPEDR